MVNKEAGWTLKIAGWVGVTFCVVPLVMLRLNLTAGMDRVDFMAMSNYAYGLAIACCILWAFVKRSRHEQIQVKTKLLMLAAIAFLAISMIINEVLPRPMFFFSVICVYWLWGLRPKAWRPVDPVAVTWPIIALVAIPIVLELSVGPVRDFYLSSSFRGVFESRTDFSFFGGLAVLAIVLSQKHLALYLLPICATGVAFAGSRAGMLAVSLALAYTGFHLFRLKQIGRLILVLLCSAWVWSAAWVFNELGHWDNQSTRIRLIGVMPWASDGLAGSLNALLTDATSEQIGLLSNSGMRLGIYMESAREILKSPLWGRGGFFQQINFAGVPIEPHSSILQSALNFGLLATLTWLLLIFAHVKRIGWAGRALIIFWFVFGLFQPGFDAYLFLPMTMAVFVLSVSMKQDVPGS